jgi:DNA-binding GntR family transcriptional regulator
MAQQLPVHIDRNSPVPLYHQVAEQLAEAIDTGVLKPGDAFENELSMAERLNLSRPTVRRAIIELVSRGLLVRRRGIGTTVANEVVHRRYGLPSLYDDLKREGQNPRTEVLQFSTAYQDDHIAEQLGLEPGTPLVFVERLRTADEGPVAVLRNWLSPEWADLEVEELAIYGLYTLIRARNIVPAVGYQHIAARHPSEAERRLLKLQDTDPVLTMTRRAYDPSGQPVEYGDHCYHWQRYAIDITAYSS